MADNSSTAFRILAFFAHPDDETIFLGGTLSFLAGRGAEIHYLCATRGEGGEMGDPPICTRGELGKMRENELRCAVKALGGKSVQLLDYQDPMVGPDNELYPFSDNVDQVAGEISQHISRIKPQIILTHGPGGEYGHPAHIQAHQALMSALSGLGHPAVSVYAPAWLSRETGKFTPEPGIKVDISPWKGQKLEAIQCHRSQHGLFTRNSSARAGRLVTIPEIVKTREALCRILPNDDQDEPDQLSDLLQEIAVHDGEDLA
ncbi:MAG: PIG-L family deacetylase [Anaerolineales bacterium]|nr:PIG-L family deacetylase [Anaerolineales bacterium]